MSGNRRRSKRISPTRSATNHFACSSSAATQRCLPNPASPSRCGRYAVSAPRRSPARCSPPTPTSRSGSSGADRLRELDVDFGTPAAAQLCARLDAVLAVVYLLFRREGQEGGRGGWVGGGGGGRVGASCVESGIVAGMEEWEDGWCQISRRRRADALSRGSRHRLGALPRADLCRHRLATDRPIVRHARSHRAVALELPEPRGRRSLPARPASRPRAPGRCSSGKRSHPLSRLARGDRRAPFPPRPTLRGRACLAGSPTLYHRPRRSRILASPPRRLPAR